MKGFAEQYADLPDYSVVFRTVADTFCKNNRIWDEWLIRDNAAIAV